MIRIFKVDLARYICCGKYGKPVLSVMRFGIGNRNLRF